jgi:hypothetical protein
MYRFEVALSFAGEQRRQVEEIASILPSQGVTVFYDDYEKADLWGKNLYDHLSDVYQHQARYCLMFLSKNYAEKVWTNLERQNAQARALVEKGTEYVLPVRFDDTEVKGIPPTLFYLDYRREGATGIVNAVLEKLGKGPAVSTPKSLSRSSSPLAFLNVNDGRIAFPKVVKSSWGNEIHLETSGDEESALFGQLRSEKPKLYVAYGLDVAEAKLTSAIKEVDNGTVRWKLTFQCMRTEFANTMEAGSGSITADKFAEMRARRILLDEYPLPELDGTTVERANAMVDESLLRGLDTPVSVLKSKLPVFTQL